MTFITQIKLRWNKLNNDRRFRKAQYLFQRLLVLGIIVLILYQLIDIGWREVLRSLPTHPLFYVLLIVMYLDLPIAEVFIYRRIWPFRKWDGFKTFITKRVYNQEVIGYSGEFYLFLWGRKLTGKPDKEIFKNIRDNSILSSLSSYVVAFILVGFLFFTGVIGTGDLAFLSDENLMHIWIAILLIIFAGTLVFLFRKYLFDLPTHTAAVNFSIYIFRFIFHHAVLLIQWILVLPDASTQVLSLLLVIYIIINRIPFLPSKDLVFMWAGIEFSRAMDATTAAIAAMLLVSSALRKLINLTLFLLITWYSKDPNPPRDPVAPVHDTDP